MRKSNNGGVNNMPKIYLDEEGYRKFLDEIRELSIKYKEVSSTKCEGPSFSSNNELNIDASFIERDREARMIYNEIQYKTRQLQNVVIVKRKDNEGLVDINDVVTLNVTGAEEQKDLIIRLVASFPDFDAEIQQISINSPMGKAIYGKPIGSTQSYIVGKNSFQITIEEKLTNKLTR